MMKKKPNYTSIILPLFLLVPFISFSQHEALTDSANTKLITAAREIITATGICTLITLDEDGVARARAMDGFPPNSNFVIWFGTNPKSRKVKQIQHDPRVTLYYFDKVTASYVLIHGEAQLINTVTDKETHWKKEWQAFYPNYPDGYALIKVSPKWMEVVSESRGIIGDSLTWQPQIVWFEK